MEDIIHYKFVNEDFSKAVEQVVMSVDPVQTFWDDPEADKDTIKEHVYTRVERQIIRLSAEELKEAMSNNEEVYIKRETIVVSEDAIKNTISLKKYFFSKAFVKTRTGANRRQFKITDKKMVSLTINKMTGEFSVYGKKREGKNKTRVFVRKNLSNPQTKSHLYDLQFTDFKDELTEAMKIFTEKLGYYDLKLTKYTDVIKYFYNVDPLDQYNQPGLPIFPFLNYLRVNNINIISYYALYYFEWIFNKNKAKYRGCNILDYMSDYYQISDKLILQTILYKLIQKNEIISQSTDTDNSKWFGKAQSRLCFIDYTKLKLFYDLNANKETGFEGEIYNYLYLLDDMLPIGSKTGYGEVFEYKEIKTLLQYYKIDTRDYFANSEIVEVNAYIRQLKLFNYFGIKLKINSIRDYKSKSQLYDIIYQCLFDAVNKSGTYLVDKKSINRLQRYFKKDQYKLHFMTNLKLKKRDESFFFERGKELYVNDSAQITVGITDKSGGVVYMRLNSITHNAHNYNPDNLKHDNHPVFSFTQKFSSNHKGLATAINYQFLYSKEYFEMLCKQNGINNIKMLVDYSRINN
jgi:hypothetical protein